MSVKVPIPLIQNINKEIQGVERAPISYPKQLRPAVMPIAICFPGEGTTSGRQSLRYMERQYMIDVYVDSVKAGIFDDPLQTTMDLIDKFVDTWSGLANDSEDWVLDYGEDSGYRVDLNRNIDITDSGWRMDLQWSLGSHYFGFRLTIPIMVRWGTGLLS